MSVAGLKGIKKYVISGVIAMGIVTAGYAVSQTYAGENRDERILDNIYIGEVAVGGMNEEEAIQAVDDYVKDLGETSFTLTVNNKNIEASAQDLGISWDNTQIVTEALDIGKTGSLISRYKDKKDLEHEPKVLEMNFSADEEKIKSFLEKNASKVNQEAQDGGLKRENGAFVVTDGKEGIEVNVDESTKTITDYFSEGWDAQGATFELTAEIVQPRGSTEELNKVKDVLGTFTTDFSSSNANRAKNVTTGCSKINGTLLYPGEGFSVYEAVTPFDEENGYEKAGSYENGTVVETYGGGICQVSTTLYNAVIRAELEITERYAHSMIVTYVQPSMDAAIAGTYKDLKFTNNTDAPVYIEGITEGGAITFTVYGQEARDENREVTFESEIVSESQPPTQIQASAEHDVGYVSVQQSSHAGKVARLWKVVTVNGKEESREIFNNSTYNASPRIITVGTRTSSDEARAIIQNAIATQNESTVYAAAANAAAVARQPQVPEKEEPAEEEPSEEPAEEIPAAAPVENKNNEEKKEDKKQDTSKEKDKSKKTEKEQPSEASESKKETDKETEVKAGEIMQ